MQVISFWRHCWHWYFCHCRSNFNIKHRLSISGKSPVCTLIKGHTNIAFWGRLGRISDRDHVTHYDFDACLVGCAIWISYRYRNIVDTSCIAIWETSWIIHSDRCSGWSCDRISLTGFSKGHFTDHFISCGWTTKFLIQLATSHIIIVSDRCLDRYFNSNFIS